MAAAWLGALAAVDVVLVVLCLRRWDPWAAVVGAVAGGIAFDAAAVALGAAIGRGDVLEGVSVARFAVHLLLTPALIPAVTELGRDAGVAPIGRRAVVLLTALAVAPAVTLAGLHLEVREQAGLLRYAEPDPLPPLGAILAVLVTLVVAIALSRRHRRRLLLVGVVVALLLFGVPPSSPAGLLVGALAETVLLGSIVLALLRVDR